MLLDYGLHLDSHENHALRSELASILHGHFFVSPEDIPIEPTYIKPGLNRATSIFHPTVYPTQMYSLESDVLHLMDRSTRSRMAIHGMEVLGFAYTDFDNEMRMHTMSDHDWQTLRMGEPVNVPIWIYNYTQNTFRIGESEPVGMHREYTEIAARHLVGDRLRTAVSSGHIHIAGIEGVDWWYLHSDPKLGNAYGIALRILPERFWLPPDPEGNIITVDYAGANARESIDTLLVPLPPHETHAYWIGETIPVDFSPRYHGLLGGNLTNGVQIKSHLMDPNRHWVDKNGEPRGLRVEILGHVNEKVIPIFFWENQDVE